MNGAIILDTDIGYDPDDIFALVLLDRLAGSRLELIITADETNGKRARLARKALSLLGNTHTRVVEGSSLGFDHFVADELINDVPDGSETRNYMVALEGVIAAHEKIMLIGIGGFTNIARLIGKHPEWRDKFEIVVMGGAIDFELKPGWIEHNIRIDIDSAQKVFESGWPLTLIMAQTTHNSDYEIGENHPFYKRLSESKEPIHRMIARHCKIWYDRKGFTTKMHDPLTVATALGKNFITLNETPLVLSEGRISVAESGQTVRWSDRISRSKDFMVFLENHLF